MFCCRGGERGGVKEREKGNNVQTLDRNEQFLTETDGVNVDFKIAVQ